VLRADIDCDRHPPLNLTADTIYFGGGTPSLLKPDRIADLLGACRSSYRIAESSEITLEVNPGTIDRDGLKSLRDIGVNRISLGIQTTRDDELRSMGRRHSAKDSFESFNMIRRAGFDNVSVDLVAGYPGQTLTSFMESLDTVISLAPEHVSVYLLEVKEGTQLEQAIRSGLVPAPDDDLQADMYEALRETITNAGYEQYEISNFAKPGYQARHNLKYWQDCVFLGFGAAAHGMTGRIRYENHRSLHAYLAAISDNRLPELIVSHLSPIDRLKDALIMGLRLRMGLDVKRLEERYGPEVEFIVLEAVEDFTQDHGLVTIKDGHVTLTERGLLLSNVVLSRWV